MTDWNKKLDEILWVEPEYGNMAVMMRWHHCLNNFIETSAFISQRNLFHKVEKLLNEKKK